MCSETVITLLSMITYNGSDVKRINHAIKVYQFADIIGQAENVSESDLFIIRLCGILHDIGIHEAEIKYNSNSGKYQEIEGPVIAEKILNENKIKLSTDQMERIKYIIGNHHTYKNINGIDFQIVVEADFLVNIYEDDIRKTEIEKIEKNIFKTKSGKQLLQSMYLGIRS